MRLQKKMALARLVKVWSKGTVRSLVVLQAVRQFIPVVPFRRAL